MRGAYEAGHCDALIERAEYLQDHHQQRKAQNRRKDRHQEDETLLPVHGFPPKASPPPANTNAILRKLPAHCFRRKASFASVLVLEGGHIIHSADAVTLAISNNCV
ncbi:hypothetical protein MESS2_730030 [Mesorhizobium metallidurans STM 2683]|uniref:Uncharacterized protein n=1 Tax=Mesorhizobium metallidurans STM 2683 TaxID=1297569 RepID=M5ET43_9HYPH|nr:hypothetical protein MESS2_730030 [Mesorhizobium metallidurans STM 2683]